MLATSHSNHGKMPGHHFHPRGNVGYNQVRLSTHEHTAGLNDLEEEKDDFDVASQFPEIERPAKQIDNQLTLFYLKRPRRRTGDRN